MKKAIWIIAAVVLAVVLGWLLFMRDDAGRQGQNGTSSEAAFAGESIITYTDQGFSPATLTVSAGSTVIVANESGEPLEFSSDKHPVHTDNSELNRSVLAPGESDSFVVSEPGTWGYHNHLNPGKTGTIVVE